MVELPDFEPGTTNIPFFLEEGDLTVDTDDIHDNGEGNGYSFSARIRKGDTVVLYTSADRTASKGAAGITEVLGEVIDRPRWVGNKPTSSQSSGNYPRRVATVKVKGSAVQSVPLEAANTAIAVGQSVKPGATTAGKYDLYHATNKNNTRAIQSAGASSGGKIGVIFGFYGNLI